jgi:transcriptional regulator with XRE-family HTH domain
MIRSNLRLNLMEFGERIKEVRGRLTQIKFGEKFDLRQAIISRLERGETRHCDLDLIYRICKENDPEVSIEWLFTGLGEQYILGSESAKNTPVADSKLANIVGLLEELLNAGNFKGLVRTEELLLSLLNKEND